MLRSFSLQAAGAGLLAAFVGFASTFAVVIKGLTAVGASQAEAASGLMALCIGMGICAICLSWWTKWPVSIAWSTPGVALLAASVPPEGGFPAAIGAFLVTGALVVATGYWQALGRWVAAIPIPLANAMLAGVLLNLCLAPARAVAEAPALGLSIVIAWAVIGKFKRLYAVPGAVLVAAVLIVTTSNGASLNPAMLPPHPVLTVPSFSVSAIIGISVPLFIVTMASQNIPGMTVMSAYGYRLDFGLMMRATGLFSIAAAPFGAHAINLAAITAALTATPDAHPDPERRYWGTIVGGAAYILLGLLAGAATAFISASPPLLIEAVAGLALLGAFGSALAGAAADADDREAALITFLVTVSGLTLFGIGGAFWGLLAGIGMRALTRWRLRRP